jgi:hypothetical protein
MYKQSDARPMAGVCNKLVAKQANSGCWSPSTMPWLKRQESGASKTAAKLVEEKRNGRYRVRPKADQVVSLFAASALVKILTCCLNEN